MYIKRFPALLILSISLCMAAVQARPLKDLLEAFSEISLDGPSVDLQGVIIKKDILQIEVEKGRITFCPPAEGIIPGGVFRGKAHITCRPVREGERRVLRRLYGGDEINETVKEIFFLFTDGFGEELLSEHAEILSPAGEAAEFFQKRFQYFQEILHPNFEFLFLQKVLGKDGRQDFFLAEFKTARKGFLSFLFSRGRALEVMLFQHTKRGPDRVLDIWSESNCQAEERDPEYLSGRYKNEKDLIACDHYRMDIEIPDRKRILFEGEVTFTSLADQLASVVFHLLNNISDFSVQRSWDEPERRVTLLSLTDRDGNPLPFLHRKHQLLVAFPEPIGKEEKYTMRFKIEAEIVLQVARNAFWFPNPSPWFPTYGYHGGRSTFDWTVRVRNPYRTVVTGQTVKEWDEEDYHCIHTVSERPVFYPGIIFGEYDGIEYHHEDMETVFKIYSLKETLGRKQREPIGERCGKALSFYTDMLGPYAFRELKVAPVAMGHAAGRSMPGMVQLTGGAFARSGDYSKESRKLDGLIAHEIAHQWWGHTVTHESDEDLWLAESFAEYLAGMYLEAEKEPREFLYKLKRWREMAMESDNTATLDKLVRMEYKYFRVGKANELLYGKGPIIIHMLRTSTGDEAFKKILHTFCTTYAGQDVNLYLFQKSVEEETGEDYGWFFNQWVRGSGIPEVSLKNLEVVSNGDGFHHRIILRQECDEGRKNWLLPVAFHFSSGDVREEKVFLTGEEEESFEFLFPEKTEKVVLDSGKETLCRVK